ncbi:hypothetical protein, partial [Streptomyces cadmiisoli]|uniref:hypothetical protein n=1 Tax=Streptomyces cadmiisoli TaxID=2184053 RepID=UPI003D729509
MVERSGLLRMVVVTSADLYNYRAVNGALSCRLHLTHPEATIGRGRWGIFVTGAKRHVNLTI